ncbi:TetR/AcrR family transcriptional regulator [Nesterenkonia ebinurensis]|uniref:TetR/AcrR family transcriptional regulator n=1 Tax=Nesterenkonia ebinurensis TaxID=2608252 RepID=UPI001CC40470|nr:TetR/AcrR family transcriptional regulator [Nesterenkonia ebinurensis]
MNAKIPDPNTLTPSARRILETASTLFYEGGITAVGVDVIAERSGVTKRTLYNRFGSKDVLVATYLLNREMRWRHLVETAVSDPELTAIERVTAPFDALGEWVQQSPRGCAFINALAELPDPEHPAHRVAAEEKRWLCSLFERLANDAHITNPADLAKQLVCLHEGALAMRAALPEIDSVTIAKDTARYLIAAATTSSTNIRA